MGIGGRGWARRFNGVQALLTQDWSGFIADLLFQIQIKYHNTVIKFQISNFRYQISQYRHQISDNTI